MVGAGGTGDDGNGGLSISNLMKPALARGRMQVIGATTLKEHKQHFEKDPALERRFQPVLVEEPSQEAALQILQGLQVCCSKLMCNSASSKIPSEVARYIYHACCLEGDYTLPMCFDLTMPAVLFGVDSDKTICM